MIRATALLALVLMASPAVAQPPAAPPQPPQFDPSKFVPPPMLPQRLYLPEYYKESPSKPAEWPDWAGWQSALGLFAACVVGGFLYGRFSRSQ
jgi:hypothetical protein